MNETTSDYWAAVSQVIPILGFALIVEARVILKHWAAGPPALQKLAALVGTLWFVVMVALVQGEMVALAALRGREVGFDVVVIVEVAVATCLITLLAIPASDLAFKAFPHPFAWVMTVGYHARTLQLWGLRLQSSVSRLKRRRTLARLNRRAGAVEARLRKLERVIREPRIMGPNGEALSDAEYAAAELELADLRSEMAVLEQERTEFLAWLRARDDAQRQYVKDVRQQVVAWIKHDRMTYITEARNELIGNLSSSATDVDARPRTATTTVMRSASRPPAVRQRRIPRGRRVP